MRNVNLERWRGRRDAVALEPAELEFAARPRRGNSCSGCCFENQWSNICDKAVAEAVKRGLPHCDDSVIYRILDRDPRQMLLVESE